MSTTIVSTIEGLEVPVPVGTLYEHLSAREQLGLWSGPLVRLVGSEHPEAMPESTERVGVVGEPVGRVVVTGPFGPYTGEVAFTLHPAGEAASSVDVAVRLNPPGVSTVLVPVDADEVVAAAVREGLDELAGAVG